MQYNRLEKITVNDSLQWVLVRGKSADAPLLIHVQAGPGLPMIPVAGTMEKQLHLENNFLVAYWDQRACGKSFDNKTDPGTINFSQLSDDIICCTKHLLEKYKKEKAIIVGYSIGATLSLMAASKDNSIFDRLFLVGLDIDISTADKHAIEFAISRAKEKNNNKLLMQALDLSKTSITNAKQFQKRAKLLTDLGGIKTGSSYNQLLITTFINMLFSKAYRLKDIPKTIKGMEFCQNALLPELNNLNLFVSIKSIDVPVHFIHGKKDGVAPYKTAIIYYEFLQGIEKTFTCFNNSAHMPHYDEPEEFAKVLKSTINHATELSKR